MSQKKQHNEAADGAEIDMAKEWGPYTSDEARDEIEAATWNLAAIKVWPAGKEGPAMPLTELAAWRAEEQRMRQALERFPEEDEADGGEET